LRVGVIEYARQVAAENPAPLYGIHQRGKSGRARCPRRRTPSRPLRRSYNVSLPACRALEQGVDPARFDFDDIFRSIEADARTKLLGRLMHHRDGPMHSLERSTDL